MQRKTIVAILLCSIFFCGCGKQEDSVRTAGGPRELVLDLGGGVTMKMVRIPAGKFTMGTAPADTPHDRDELPQHEVTLSRPFYMGIYEVTQAQYEAVSGTNPSNLQGATRPVESVLRAEMIAFCTKMSQKTGCPVRLPTEAQWEYACRAGTTTRYFFGGQPDKLGEYAVCRSDNGDLGTIRPVGQKKPNPWGLYDMLGNVEECCGDWFGPYPDGPVTDPTGPASGDLPVTRGGSAYSTPAAYYCRCASRGAWHEPQNRAGEVGFRVVADAPR